MGRPNSWALEAPGPRRRRKPWTFCYLAENTNIPVILAFAHAEIDALQSGDFALTA